MPNGNTPHTFDATAAEVVFEPLLDLTEAAALLRVHPQTLKKMAIRRAVPAIKLGRLWRFRASDLQHWLDSRVLLVENDSERRASERRH
jgi:excisionase family DNA binding protein